MKKLFLILIYLVCFSSFSYAQNDLTFKILSSENFDREIKKPKTIETVKDTFQGVWQIDLISQTGEVKDTYFVTLQNYSARTPNLVFFSSTRILIDSEEPQNVTEEPEKIIFFQSGTKSTIRFNLPNNKTADFDGTITEDLIVEAQPNQSTQSTFGELQLKATKIADDFGLMWQCGNADTTEGVNHGRHFTHSDNFTKYTEQYGCKNWRKGTVEIINFSLLSKYSL